MIFLEFQIAETCQGAVPRRTCQHFEVRLSLVQALHPSERLGDHKAEGEGNLRRQCGKSKSASL